MAELCSSPDHDALWTALKGSRGLARYAAQRDRPGAHQWQYGKPKLTRPEALVAEVTSVSGRMGIQMSVSSGPLSPSWSQPLFVMMRSPVTWQHTRRASSLSARLTAVSQRPDAAPAWPGQDVMLELHCLRQTTACRSHEEAHRVEIVTDSIADTCTADDEIEGLCWEKRMKASRCVVLI